MLLLLLPLLLLLMLLPLLLLLMLLPLMLLMLIHVSNYTVADVNFSKYLTFDYYNTRNGSLCSVNWWALPCADVFEWNGNSMLSTNFGSEPEGQKCEGHFE